MTRMLFWTEIKRVSSVRMFPHPLQRHNSCSSIVSFFVFVLMPILLRFCTLFSYSCSPFQLWYPDSATQCQSPLQLRQLPERQQPAPGGHSPLHHCPQVCLCNTVILLSGGRSSMARHLSTAEIGPVCPGL